MGRSSETQHACSAGWAYLVLEPKKPGGPHYLAWLRKASGRSGADVLSEAERCVASRPGGRVLQLQDTSFVVCAGRGSAEYALGFRYQLAHGRTWYEARGYAPVGAAARAMRARVQVAVQEYARTPVDVLRRAVNEQVARLAKPSATWTFVDSTLRNHISMVTLPNLGRRAVVRSRRRLRALLSAAPDGALLGPWLCALPCADYAFVMEALYGGRIYEQGPRWAVAEVDGARTPTLALFKRANALERFTGRIRWSKDVTL